MNVKTTKNTFCFEKVFFKVMVDLKGIEPSTLRMRTVCSPKLSYKPITACIIRHSIKKSIVKLPNNYFTRCRIHATFHIRMIQQFQQKHINLREFLWLGIIGKNYAVRS